MYVNVFIICSELCLLQGCVCLHVLSGQARERCPPLPGSCGSGCWGGQLEGHKAVRSLNPFPFSLSSVHLTEEKTSPFLREVQVNLIDFRKCNDYLVYDSYLTPRMMCAGDLRGGRDSCQVGLLPGGVYFPGLGCWGWNGSCVPTISCSRTTSPTLLMRIFPPVGRQWGALGL